MENPQMEVSFRDIAATSYLLRDRITQTQCVKSQLSDILRCGCLYLKLEYKQCGGSYKTRGAFNALMTIPREDRKRGIVAAAQGNYGVALSYAGNKLGIPITLVFPRLAQITKVQIARKNGANVLVDGADLSDSRAIACALARNERKKFIDIFSNFALCAGNVTVGLETGQQVPMMDYFLVPMTAEKSILRGFHIAIKKICPCCKIYGVRGSELCPPDRLETTGDSFFDRVIDVSDDEILTAFLLLVEVEKVLVEPKSATALAAITSRKYSEFLGKNVVVFLGNGNVDLGRVTKLLQNNNVITSNIITFSVLIPDEMGTLAKLCAEISRHEVSIRDIVFPKESNNGKMLMFCETTGPEHTKIFIRNMLSAYPSFELIPLKCDDCKMIETQPYYKKCDCKGGSNDRRESDNRGCNRAKSQKPSRSLESYTRDASPSAPGNVSGDYIERSGDRIGRSGDCIDRSGDRIERSGDRIERSGDRIERSGDRIYSRSGDRTCKSGDRIERSGSRIERSGSRIERSGSRIERSGSCIEKSGSRIEKSGGRIEKSGGRIERSGEFGSQDKPRSGEMKSRERCYRCNERKPRDKSNRSGEGTSRDKQNRSKEFRSREKHSRSRELGSRSQHERSGELGSRSQHERSGELGSRSQHERSGELRSRSQHERSGELSSRSQHERSGESTTRDRLNKKGECRNRQGQSGEYQSREGRNSRDKYQTLDYRCKDRNTSRSRESPRDRTTRRSKSCGDDYRYHPGYNSRDTVDNNDGAIMTNQYEEIGHHKVYTVDAYDNNLTPIGSMRIEEKCSVTKSVGRFEHGGKTQYGTSERYEQSKTVSQFGTDTRYRDKRLRDKSDDRQRKCPDRQPSRSRELTKECVCDDNEVTAQARPARRSKDSQEYTRELTMENIRDDSENMQKIRRIPSESARKSKDCQARSREITKESICDSDNDQRKSDQNQARKYNRSQERSNDTVERYDSRGEQLNRYGRPKTPPTGSQESLGIANDPYCFNRERWISIEAMDFCNRRDTCRTHSDPGQYHAECIEPREKPHCGSDQQMVPGSKHSTTNLNGRPSSKPYAHRDSYTKERDMHCECGRIVSGCTGKTCPAYRARQDSENTTTGGPCKQGRSRSDETARDSISCCTASTVSTAGGSDRLDAGANANIEFLLHDGDYENCPCCMAIAKQQESFFVEDSSTSSTRRNSISTITSKITTCETETVLTRN